MSVKYKVEKFFNCSFWVWNIRYIFLGEQTLYESISLGAYEEKNRSKCCNLICKIPIWTSLLNLSMYSYIHIIFILKYSYTYGYVNN